MPFSIPAKLITANIHYFAYIAEQTVGSKEEARCSLIFVKHDPMLCEDAKQMMEYVGQALKQTSREAAILLYAPALDPHLQRMTELADRVLCIYEGKKAPVKGRAKCQQISPLGRRFMRWLWKRDAKLIEPRPMINPKVLELQTAKDILAEVFHVQPGEVEEMVQRRLEERIWDKQEAREEGLWPATFSLNE
ncbi:MAG: hypothetical protein LUP94_00625 [Candidatus Methanomethylicus sp.]|nr:hypothetical protein [Candidatus Methanomethylicus sp.]